jgi:hypothetical protein
MHMRFFWVGDKVAQEMYKLRRHPGQENLANYQSKHHAMSHHINVRPWYLHMENSPRFLPRAQKSSALKGCVGTLDDGYIHNVPLPRAPWIQSTSHVTCHRAIMRDGSTPLHSTPLHGSTPLHTTPLMYKQIHRYRVLVTCHVTEPSCVMGQLHTTPLHRSTPLRSTPLAYKQIHG